MSASYPKWGAPYGISPVDIRSNKRSANISNARQDLHVRGAEITQISMASIGEEFAARITPPLCTPFSRWRKTSKGPAYREMIEDIIKISKLVIAFHIPQIPHFHRLNGRKK